jgi:outer membrane protein OmpU
MEMRKALLGTSALVAASLIGAADAQAKFDVTVRGNYTAAYGFVNEDDDDGESGNRRQNQALNQDVEVHFRFEQTFDNGIIAGGRVELEGASHNPARVSSTMVVPNDSARSGSAGDDQIDEKWGYLRGGFGELRFGDEDDVRKLKALVAPEAAAPFFGVNSPMFSFNNGAAGQAVGTNTTLPNLENDSAKVIYFSPSFGGFQLGASYAPDGTQDRFQGGTGGTQDTLSNATSIAADYAGDLGGVKVNLYGGYSFANAETSEADPNIWGTGINVRFGAFAVGGSIAFTDADTGGDDERTVFDVGGMYTMDAMAVSLAWSHGEYENEGETDELDHVQLAVGYTLGEGVRLGAMVGLFSYEDEGPTDSDNSGWQTAVGINMGF